MLSDVNSTIQYLHNSPTMEFEVYNKDTASQIFNFIEGTINKSMDIIPVGFFAKDRYHLFFTSETPYQPKNEFIGRLEEKYDHAMNMVKLFWNDKSHIAIIN